MTASPTPPAAFFRTRRDLRRWFELHHASARELWIGYPKAGRGASGVTYAEAVEEALCFGWIDGQVRSLGPDRYANRYSPRRPGSRWSRVNVAKAEALLRAGRMQPAGTLAFSQRERGRAGYSFEERPHSLGTELEKVFRARPDAWSFYSLQPPGYRRTTAFWVRSAREATTRLRRLDRLIECSATGCRLDLLAPFRLSRRPAEGATQAPAELRRPRARRRAAAARSAR